MRTYSPVRIPASVFDGSLSIGPMPESETDVDAIRRSGADVLVTVSTDRELASFGLAELGSLAKRRGMTWIHVPIEDFGIPDETAARLWRRAEVDLLARLTAGERVHVHCRAGRGRSGMIAARLLAAAGMEPQAAIGAVRSVRPGAIETEPQEAWVAGAEAE